MRTNAIKKGDWGTILLGVGRVPEAITIPRPAKNNKKSNKAANLNIISFIEINY